MVIDEISFLEKELGITDEFYDCELNDESHIVSLNLYNTEYTEFPAYNGNIMEIIAKFTRLKSITIEIGDYTIEDIGPVVSLVELEKLSLEDCTQIDDISVLKHLHNLESILINNSNITDIGPIAGLTKLKFLFLAGNNISDIIALAGNTSLTHISLSNNHLTDISAIANCSELLSLSVAYNELTNLSFLGKLRQLEHLFINNNAITDISFLTSLTRMKNLVLHNNPINSINPLTYLYDLVQLSILNVTVEDLVPISNATKLTFLAAGPVASFNPDDIGALHELTRLHLESCTITDVAFVLQFKKLFHLNFNHNHISDVLPLYKAKSLSYIYLRDNFIREPFLAINFSNLNCIDLRENPFGNKMFVRYVFDHTQENQAALHELSIAIADYYYRQGKDDYALAFFYAYSTHKTSLKIYFKKLLQTSPKEIYFYKYYVMRCKGLLQHTQIIDRKDPEIEEISDKLKDIVSVSNFSDKDAILQSLDNLKQYYEYNPYKEYIKYLTIPYVPKEEHPQMLFEMGKLILKKQTLLEVLYIYKTLVKLDDPFQYPMYEAINSLLKNQFAPVEKQKHDNYKAVLDHINESFVPDFDLIAYYKKRFTSAYYSAEPKCSRIASDSLNIYYLIPTVWDWKMIARLILLLLSLYRLLRILF